MAVSLRQSLLLPLDDLLAVVREFLNPNVSRSGLDRCLRRCLRRHGVGSLRDLKPKVAKPAHKPFKAYEPGYIHIDVKYLPQMADEEKRRYLFVAIARATRWVFVRIYPVKTAANARRFLRAPDRAGTGGRWPQSSLGRCARRPGGWRGRSRRTDTGASPHRPSAAGISRRCGCSVSVRCAPPNGADFDGLVSTIDSGHLGALYGCEAEEAALAG